MLEAAYTRGAREAFAKFGLYKQPALSKKEFKLPKAKDLPPMPPPVDYKTRAEHDGVGVDAAKNAAAVGMAASSGGSGSAGAVPGEPADGGHRAKSTIDRAFQQNEDIGETSAMPRPAGGAYP